MRPESSGLPFVDEHRMEIPAPREVVWTALREHVGSSLRAGERNPLTLLLGTEPRAGFEVVREVPEHALCLAGRHRFSRYELVFEIADNPSGGTLLRARTSAEFPGARGRAYRALVIGSRLHVVAMKRMLRAIRRRVVR